MKSLMMKKARIENLGVVWKYRTTDSKEEAMNRSCQFRNSYAVVVSFRIYWKERKISAPKLITLSKGSNTVKAGPDKTFQKCL